MQIDLEQLRKNVTRYIHDPNARQQLAEEENSVLFNTVATICFVPLGLLLMCTIVFAKIGWALVSAATKSIVTGEVFEDPVKALQDRVDEFQIHIASPVMVGPQGFGLLLFSESPESAARPTLIANKARLLFDYYSGKIAPLNADDQKLVDLLQDDQYVPDRRRLIPGFHADGQKLVLLDTEVKSQHIASLSPGQQIMLCAIVPSSVEKDETRETGNLIYLPWQLASEAAI